ncbi:cytochrome c551 [Ectobacillus polymachus]|uniref:cytochrome c551 n=1 Tax=Ectobacillus polymachus TaxID=1508806 RepID=UPI003A89A362
MKRKLLIGMTGMALIAGLSACGTKEESQSSNSTKQPASTDSAEAIYQQSCASCHGTNQEGRRGPNLQKVGDEFSQAQIEKIIANGRGPMPAGLIPKEDATKVAEWLSQKK